jgi:hypothetical protein
VVTRLSSASVVRDRSAVASAPDVRLCFHVSNLRVISADAPVETRDDSSSPERRDPLDTEKCKIEANCEMRNMRSDDDLSDNHWRIVQKSKPKFAVSRSSILMTTP